MKTIIQSFIISFVVHFLVIGGTLLFGYVKTKKYKPVITNQGENVEILHQEVAFGVGGSPLFLLFTFIGFALISGLLLICCRKILTKRRR